MGGSVAAAENAVAAGRDITNSALGEGSSVTTQHFHLPPAPEVSWPLRVGAPPLLASSFQPRPALREAIDEARLAGRDAVLAQVLSGGGGVGKSQLAAAYAHDATLAGTDLVLWVAATDVQQLITLYAQTARLVHAPSAHGEDPENDARALLDWLATTTRSWLIVLDDVTDPGALTPWWPSGRAGQGWVLATTRLKDGRLTGQGRRRVDIDVYTPAEAVAYLEHRLTTDGASHLLDGHQDQLAAELGRLPLALGHAAAYLLNQQIPCAEYLALLRRREQQLDDAMPAWADTENYGRQITATLLLSLTAAETASPRGLARSVLRLAALLDPAGHPHTLWNTPTVLTHLTHTRSNGSDTAATTHPAGAEEVRATLLVLHRYALITYDTRAPHQQVRIHALTARATRESTPLSEQADLARTAADALLDIWPDPDQHHRELASVLRTNTETLTQHTSHHLWHDKPHGLLFRTGNSLRDNGLPHAALIHWLDLLTTAEQLLGTDHPDTHIARANLAVTYSSLGRYDEALQLKQRVLTARERILGDDHPDTHLARANLAVTYSSLGRHDETLRLEEQVLTAYQRLLGDDHPDTHLARNNLAVTYSSLGRYDEALRLEEQVLTAYQRLLGDDHPDTHLARNNLAATYSDHGRYDEALQLKQRVLTARERFLGDDHPDTHLARANLAVTYSSLGRHDETLQLEEQVLTAYQRLLGDDHPDAHRARNNLAATYSSLGRHDEALHIKEQVLTAYQRLLGDDHPDTLRARNNLAATYNDLGRHDEALQLEEQVLTARERLLGDDHPETHLARANLALTYRDLGRHDEALRLGEQVLTARERLLGHDHPHTHSARANLAATYSDLGRHDEALQLEEQVLTARERLLGDDHPQTLLARANLAVTYSDLGRYDEALQLEEQVLTARERLLGDDHPDTHRARNNLAITYSNLARRRAAEQLLDRRNPQG
ncbi:tetratricopeptide repeat protein [Streptomyces sp. NPDC054961]